MQEHYGSLTGIDSIPLVSGIVLIPCVEVSRYPGIIIFYQPHCSGEREFDEGNEATADKVTKQGPFGLNDTSPQRARQIVERVTYEQRILLAKLINERAKVRKKFTHRAILSTPMIKPRHPWFLYEATGRAKRENLYVS